MLPEHRENAFLGVSKYIISSDEEWTIVCRSQNTVSQKIENEREADYTPFINRTKNNTSPNKQKPQPASAMLLQDQTKLAEQKEHNVLIICLELTTL